MALIPLIVGGNFLWILETFGFNYQVFQDNYPDQENIVRQLVDFLLNADKATDVNDLWYIAVGFQILSNIFMNVLMPNATEFIKVTVYRFLNKIIICCANCLISTQDELNDLYSGQEFRIYERYSFFINHLALCVVFAPIIPALWGVGFLGALAL